MDEPFLNPITLACSDIPGMGVHAGCHSSQLWYFILPEQVGLILVCATNLADVHVALAATDTIVSRSQRTHWLWGSSLIWYKVIGVVTQNISQQSDVLVWFRRM